jgi:hypothetical protein
MIISIEIWRARAKVAKNFKKSRKSGFHLQRRTIDLYLLLPPPFFLLPTQLTINTTQNYSVASTNGITVELDSS